MTTPAEILKPTTATEKPCRECGSLFTPDFLPHLVHVCQVCSERHSIEESRRMARESEQRVQRNWETVCPAQYRETDTKRLPHQAAFQRVMRWQLGPRGLLLNGPTGAGKSRCAWVMLKREYENRHRVLAMDHSIGFRYAERFANSAAEAASWIDRLASVEILFLDDIFKAKMTDSLEQCLFTVIATRCEEKRPTICTMNDTSDSLKARLSPDRGAALIRRLVESSEHVSFV